MIGRMIVHPHEAACTARRHHLLLHAFTWLSKRFRLGIARPVRFASLSVSWAMYTSIIDRKRPPQTCIGMPMQRRNRLGIGIQIDDLSYVVEKKLRGVSQRILR